jgi:hypothetical protein
MCIRLDIISRLNGMMNFRLGMLSKCHSEHAAQNANAKNELLGL